MEFHGTVLETAKWMLLAVLGSIFIVPLAWVNAAAARWLCNKTTFSDGTVATFRGTGGDVVVWHVLLLLLAIFQQVIVRGGDQDGKDVPVLLVLYVASSAIAFTLLKWFVYNIHLNTGPQMTFTGGFLVALGWYLGLLLSFVSVIGWAWVAVAMYRWMASHVKGQGTAVEFRGGGFEFLWRTLVVAIGSCLIVTIPFLANWYLKWFVQNFVLIRGVETSFEELIAQRKTPRSQTLQAGPPVFGPID